MFQFKKPKHNKRSLRKKDRLDIDALEAEAISTGLGTSDFGSRSDGRRKAREEQKRSETGMRTTALPLGQTVPAASDQVVVNDMGLDDDEDDDLHQSVKRARKLALQKQVKKALVGPEAIARLATTIKSSQTADEQNPATEESQKGEVVFSEVEGFVWGLQLDQDAHKAGAADVLSNEDDAAVATHDTMMEDGKEVAQDETIHEVPIGKGLRGVVELLRQRGSLEEGIDWGGRDMDKKKSKLVGIVDTDDGEDKEKAKNNKDKDYDRFKDLRIERRNEFGQIMAPKEAYRKLSHAFHGKAPGKRKIEKQMKRYQEEQKLKQMKNSDASSLSVERVQLKRPYLFL